jgi:hypothetical protein
MAPPEQHDYEPVSGLSFEDKEVDVPYSDQNSEDEPFLESRAPLRLSRIKRSLPWILCAVFATTSAVLTFLLFRQKGRIGVGYINDFRKSFHARKLTLASKAEFCCSVDPASIPLEQVRFTGSPEFDSQGKMHHKPWDESTPWPENVRYFGEPSLEIDENWSKLIGLRYFSISEEEAKSVWPDSYNDYIDQLQGGYTAG